jgi:mannose-1-phosphate guanylyltransferase
MNAMLLAAGLGRRMLPLTLSIPKPVVPVLGRPLSAQILKRLAGCGVTNAVVNLHHMADHVRSTLGDGPSLGLDRIEYSFEERILGTGGGIGKVATRLRGGGCFIVHNSDCLSDVDLGALVRAHRDSGCLATLALTPSRRGYPTVEIDASCRVVAIGGRPQAAASTGVPYLFTGVHVISDDLLERIPGDRPADIVTDVYLDLIPQARLGAFVHDGFWWEFGSPAAYFEGSLRLLDLPEGRIASIAETDPIRDIHAARVAVGEDADFDAGVVLVGRVALGAASRIGEGSAVEDSIVMPGAWIPPGTQLRRTIVGPGTELPIGSELQDCLICTDTEPDSDPPPGATRQDDLLFAPLPPENGPPS